MLGTDIKNYIEQNGIKQTYISEKTGMSVQALNAVLNGSRKIEATEYYKICGALNVPLNYFFKTDEQAACREVS